MGAGHGLKQYREAQAWKRADFVAAEAEKLFASDAASTAFLLIDYSEIRLDQYGKRTADQTSHIFTDAETTRALANHLEFKEGIECFNEHEMLIRTSFDALLTGLEKFHHYIETDLIALDDAKVHFRYWIPKMADPRTKWKDREFYVALHQFVNAYEYQGVRALISAFGIPDLSFPGSERELDLRGRALPQ